MKIESAIFVKSATKKEHYPRENFPEVAFVGKSNVGKSSLINCLLNRKGLVKTSSTPGKTQLINFFKINDNMVFVDLPGFGYAKIPLSIKKNWGKMIETYLMDRENLKLVVSLVDIRRDPDDDVLRLVEWFQHYEIPFVTAITKADKARKGELADQKNKIINTLGINPESVILCSIKTGLGKKELWKQISLYTQR
jgi:GTP-binding protein